MPKEELKIATLVKKIEKIKPDTIYLNGLFLYNFLLASMKYKKKNNIKIVIAPRGELCKNALNLKKTKKKLYISFLKIIKLNNKVYWHATANDEKEGIQKEVKGKEKTIYFTEEVLPQNKIMEEKKTIKQPGKLKCVFISRICEKKNLISAIKYVEKIEDGVTLDIYGFKEDKDYWKKCEEKIGNNKNIKYCGSLNPDDVIKTFNQYDLFLFPTYSENFGYVIAESMLATCPVLISNQTPWSDVKEANAGFVIELGEDKKFIEMLRIIKEMDKKEYDVICENCNKYIKQKVNNEGLAKKYEIMFQNDISSK